ncbi:hypothetical protein BC443_16715 [Salinicola sp. MIT1003]|nr:hypothetical protein BC443_16715 [Salinicola sp. MIT1003]
MLAWPLALPALVMYIVFPALLALIFICRMAFPMRSVFLTLQNLIVLLCRKSMLGWQKPSVATCVDYQSEMLRFIRFGSFSSSARTLMFHRA